jgi:hypothetical protein
MVFPCRQNEQSMKLTLHLVARSKKWWALFLSSICLHDTTLKTRAVLYITRRLEKCDLCSALQFKSDSSCHNTGSAVGRLLCC